VAKDEVFPSLSEIKDAADNDTVGIILVDIAGERNPYIWDILKYAKNQGYFVILDSSHSHGLLAQQDRLYSEIDAQVLSLYPTKIITSATGGIVLSNDEALADYLNSARHHGANINGGLNNCEVLGGGFYSSEFDAALGVVMINHLPEIINRRIEIAKKYDAVILEINKIHPVATNDSVYYKYQVLCDSIDICKKVKSQMNKKGINVGAVYNPPIHQQPLYKNVKEYGLNNTNDISSRIIAIPMHNRMTDYEVDAVVEAISEIQTA
jgi:dTDP-4-amino-4,6-dideoxygalactose transaminase